VSTPILVGHLPADTTIDWAKNVFRAVFGRPVIARCGVEYDHDALVDADPADIEDCRSCFAGTRGSPGWPPTSPRTQRGGPTGER
jgi:hypothetical protein